MMDRATRSTEYRTPLAVLVLTLAAFGAGPCTLAAEGEQGDWELGFFGGYTLFDEYDGAIVPLNPEDDAFVGARVGFFASPRWSFEGSYQYLSTETELPTGPPDFEFKLTSFRFNLLNNFRPGERLRPFVTLGIGHEELEVPGTVIDEDDPSAIVGGGIRWFAGRHFGLRFDARWVGADVSGPLQKRQDNVETTIGLLWAFGGRTADADADGVPDRRDRCPDTPPGAVVDDDGCPVDSDGDGVPDGIDDCPDTPPGVITNLEGCPKDSDGDGVFDGPDKCPDTPTGAKVDAAGCPKDSDSDGVFDGLDRCPDSPKGATVDAAGCPKDSDGDGVFDGIDKCPGSPSGAIVDLSGCPKDSDGDGVLDGVDRCPGTPRNTRVDARGCTLLFEEGRNTLVLRGVNFEFDSDELTRESLAILDGVAASLREWSEVRVEIAGHTDSQGGDAYNLALSKRRADAVRRYLIDRGVASANLTARGYGEAHPIGDNATAEGRRENRRVELKKR